MSITMIYKSFSIKHFINVIMLFYSPEPLATMTEFQISYFILASYHDITSVRILVISSPDIDNSMCVIVFSLCLLKAMLYLTVCNSNGLYIDEQRDYGTAVCNSM